MPSLLRMRLASVYDRSPEWAPWLPPPRSRPSAMEFAAWLGLIPRQHSTGGKARLLGISKRGSVYLRRMFIHGARAMLLRVKYDTGRLGQWAHQLELRAPRNKVVVAVANKLARIAWAVLATGQQYRTAAVAAA